MEKEKKPRKPRATPAPKPPKSVDELVQHALTLAATNPKAKWLGKSPAALFNEKEENHKAAIERCTDANHPLLKQVKDGGALTSAGVEKVVTTLPEAQVAELAKSVAKGQSAKEKADFLQSVISRTPATAPELNPLLEEAIAAEKAEAEARVADIAQEKAAKEEQKKAVARFLELLDEREKNALDALRREWEARGQQASELPVVATSKSQIPGLTKPVDTSTKSEPETAEDNNFRRDVAKQLAETWRVAWKENKHEGRDYLESAIWNVSGLRMVGEAQARVAFDGRYHECETPVFTSDQVRVIRPGWVLEEGESDYVAIKALVEKV